MSGLVAWHKRRDQNGPINFDGVVCLLMVEAQVMYLHDSMDRAGVAALRGNN